MYRISIAYILWFISGFGALGLHRFYLGKIGTGLLWFFTGGLGMIGAVFDFFYIPTMVQEANLGSRYRDALFDDMPGPLPFRQKESIEKVILRTAKKNKGVISPGEVALEGNITMDQAKDYLDKLTAQGYVEMKIRKSGIIAYTFPEFMQVDEEFEDIQEQNQHGGEITDFKIIDTPAELSNLKSILDEMGGLVGRTVERRTRAVIEEYIELDRRFHTEICALARNEYINRFYRETSMHLNMSFRYGVGLCHGIEATYREHQEICRHLSENSQKAVDVIETHLLQSRQNILNEPTFQMIED